MRFDNLKERLSRPEPFSAHFIVAQFVVEHALQALGISVSDNAKEN